MHQTIREGYREGSLLDTNAVIKPPTGAIDIAWDHTMLQFGCCGSEHVHDFEKNATHWSREIFSHHRKKARVPLMCCTVTAGAKQRTRLSLKSARFQDAENCMKHMSMGDTNLQVDRLAATDYDYTRAIPLSGGISLMLPDSSYSRYCRIHSLRDGTMALARTSGHVLANTDNMAVFWSRRKQLELRKTLQVYVYLQFHQPMADRKSEW
ncbi:hypothetical protein NP493_1013g01018 [Ridgeia piscesae]|uniref:Uncharacterized protein n=1 Tax=Ridgeia piscesae TaxID=27915 RepID=A0AAD9KIK0_RIDPI|nr:hypothetical protein NP493_1013g01018 [Ridgeia piscesae]